MNEQNQQPTARRPAPVKSIQRNVPSQPRHTTVNEDDYSHFLNNRSDEEDKRRREAYMKRREAHLKAQRRQRRIFISVTAAIAVALIVGIALLFRSCTANKIPNELLGTWRLDSGAVYTFEKNGTGTLNAGSTDYTFTYTVKKDELSIDFTVDSLTDGKYTFSVDGDTITMVGGEGTVGGTYLLTKNQ